MAMKVESFLDLYDGLVNHLKSINAVEKISEDFKHLGTDCDRVKFLMTTLDNLFEINLNISHKCSDKAVQSRLLGNEFFKHGDMEKSLLEYNKSLFYFPLPTSPDNKGIEPNVAVAFTYANRAAVLLEIQEYESSLSDISEACKYGYPESQMFKLLERKAKCLLGLSRSDEAKVAIEQGKKSVYDNTLDEKLQSQWINKFNILSKSQQNLRNSSTIVFPINFSESGLKNPQAPSLSSALQIACIEGRGRSIIANEKIEPGVLVMTENPYSRVLLPQHWKTHCSTCLSRLYNAVPCLTCSNVGFCSYKCQKVATQGFHSFECIISNHLFDEDLGKMALLALRIITSSKLESFGNIWSDLKTNGGEISFPVPYVSSDYLNVYNIVAHSCDRSIGDLFKRTVMAVYLVELLKKTSYFTSFIVNDSIHIGSIILRHIQNLACNAHSVTELCLGKSLQDSHELDIAAAVYPTLSLFNHSCDPNVVRFFIGPKAFVLTIKSVDKGQEIVDSYGCHYAVQPKEERQAKLKRQYFFSCQCPPCVEDWPLYSNLNSKFQLKCIYCGRLLQPSEGVCSCGKKLNLPHQEQIVKSAVLDAEKALAFVLKRDAKSAYHLAVSSLKIFELCCRTPWSTYNNCQEVLKQCFSLSGNIYYSK